MKKTTFYTAFVAALIALSFPIHACEVAEDPRAARPLRGDQGMYISREDLAILQQICARGHKAEAAAQEAKRAAWQRLVDARRELDDDLAKAHHMLESEVEKGNTDGIARHLRIVEAKLAALQAAIKAGKVAN